MDEPEDTVENTTDGDLELTPEAADAFAKLADLDRVLPRSIEDWVADRDREGLHVPEILKSRLAEKEKLRQTYRDGQIEASSEDNVETPD